MGRHLSFRGAVVLAPTSCCHQRHKMPTTAGSCSTAPAAPAPGVPHLKRRPVDTATPSGQRLGGGHSRRRSRAGARAAFLILMSAGYGQHTRRGAWHGSRAPAECRQPAPGLAPAQPPPPGQHQPKPQSGMSAHAKLHLQANSARAKGRGQEPASGAREHCPDSGGLARAALRSKKHS